MVGWAHIWFRRVLTEGLWYNPRMILDGLPYVDLKNTAPAGKSIQSFVRFIEKKLGIKAVYDARDLPLGRADLLEQMQIAQKLIDKGVITHYQSRETFPDEPSLRIWGCVSGKTNKLHTGGASFSNDAAALTAALAESLERYIWYTQQDYFVAPIRATVKEIASHGLHIAPEQFTSFSNHQRKSAARLFLDENASYLWIQADSLTSKKKVYVPAQTVSPTVPGASNLTEPLIRQQTTIGLATWPTQKGAQLAGTLEIIEREAWMILWYNQFTLPQIDLDSVRSKRKDLDDALAACERYNLKVSAIPMMTDAPTHAVCVILEDTSGVAPRFAIGLKAHRSLPYAIERALTEALRARLGYRNFFLYDGIWDPKTPAAEVGHIERLHYWGVPKNAERLTFLVAGEKIPYTFDAPWENDSEEKHLERVLDWCREKDFSCVSVPLGTSNLNPTPWHIEMVVMPDLHPTHLHEQYRHLGGVRLSSVPTFFGYTPRSEPFTDSPHPYA